LIRRNKFTHCTKCKRRASRPAQMGWIAEPCGGNSKPIKAIAAPVKRGPPPDEGRWTTREIAHRLQREDLATLRKVRKTWLHQAVHSIQEAVDHNVAQQASLANKRAQEAASYSNTYYKRMRADNDASSSWIRPDGAHIEFTTTANTTITIHASHNSLVECGGYVGCKICNRYGSFCSPTDGMKQPCRGKPPPCGTMREVGNLTKGKWPHRRGPAKNKGQHTPSQPVWPSGVTDPRPYFYRLGASEPPGNPPHAAPTSTAEASSTP